MPASAPLRWLHSLPLVVALRADRLLAWSTLAASSLVLLPLTQTPFLPLTDLPNQAAMASQVARLWSGDPVVERFFTLQPHPSPYWLLYALIAISSWALPVLLAVKVVVAAALLLVPLGMMRLLLALGRSPRMGLFAFALSWDFSMSMGFVAFCLTTGLGLFFLAIVVGQAKRPHWRGILGGVLLGLTLSFGHAHAAGAIATLCAGLALAELPRWRVAARTFALGLIPLVGLLPWILLGSSSENRAIPARIWVWPEWGERVARMFHFSLDQVNGLLPKSALALAFLLLLLVPLLLTRLGWLRSDRRAFALYLSAWALYLLLPSVLYWPFFQLLIYERGVTLLLLAGLALPRARALQHPGWLAPGLVATALVASTLTWQFREFGSKTRPLLEIIDAVPAGSLVLPLLYEQRTDESVRETLTQMSAYVVAAKGGYTPFLFQTPNLPVRYREAEHLPHPEWTKPNAFHLVRHGRFFDFVLVQGKPGRLDGKGRQFEGRRIRLEEARQAGMWTLYAVDVTPAASPD